MNKYKAIVSAFAIITVALTVIIVSGEPIEEEVVIEETTTSVAETEETIDIIRELAERNSAMPCETAEDVISATETAPYEAETESSDEVATETEEPSYEPSTEAEEVIPLYRIGGADFDVCRQMEIYGHLKSVGCEFFYEYALCQAFQESRDNPYAENPNGLDKGEFQFRRTYWDGLTEKYGINGADIFDFYAQTYVFSRRVAEFTSVYGQDVLSIISAHNTGGYGYNQAYVNQVIQWYPTLERIN